MIAVQKCDLTELNRLLIRNGKLNVLPYDEIKKIPRNDLLYFMAEHAVYTLPTLELIEWLRSEIGMDIAIEICAGNGAIGRKLTIPITDSRVQETELMKFYYASIGHKPIIYPDDVQKYEALEAVEQFKPGVVVGAYVTQLFQEGDILGVHGSSVHGVNELELVKSVNRYIKIGNDRTHGGTRVMDIPHEEYKFEWLVTRTSDQSTNTIWVWDKQKR